MGGWAVIRMNTVLCLYVQTLYEELVLVCQAEYHLHLWTYVPIEDEGNEDK